MDFYLLLTVHILSYLTILLQASPLAVTNLTVVTNATSPTTVCKQYPPLVDIVCADLLGDVHSATTYVKRDLGFQGQIGPYVLLSYGDTLYSDASYSDTWRGMTSDSVALATQDPLVVVDPFLNTDGYPPQFCPLISSFGEDPSECAMGITNVVETTAPNEGIIFFLLNHRPNGTNNLMGAGVASIILDTSSYPPVPQISRLPPQYWWDATCEPWYGDVCALRWKDHIYAYGHGMEGNPWVYLTRVRADEATNVNCYEYWNGEAWQSGRLDGTAIGEKESVFWQINQGQVIWSNYFGYNWMNSKVLLKTAQRPEGPWSDPITLYQATPLTDGSSIYAAVPHPYFDESGKSLVVTFTNHPNTIQAVRIVFA
ncbi:hypothetical protein A1O7_08421 [Cladophialophora yegresii CBS 114405]|uniref:DUF4185 domain-containing protein n=1 Tax=Cladophialophora yegresii CBS 114405 TaxID=1182544 RepID=W9WAA1_9EURO|nr:uncharacterized protein A1O7_08421 [Cladophialophora yegresii CBS 114405]EXJ55494.1 hypothetical protein A1O7_08421 [Cladophialophora yegresii CBS 114405]